ncbi:glycoside hydrolase family 2 protein [Alistipes sp.]|uniref:glycoside hydrolase family 2 protein n=1 Tax=Alistipes sp. TaxID=1872444 RepID=UPI003AF94F79
MKRIWILIAGVFMLTQLSARDVININRDWRFFSHTEGSSDRAQGVNLPHMWNNDALSGRNDYFRGVGNYMKDIAVPKEWAGRRIFVRFGGAGTVADLIVNGRYVGEHRGGYSAFTFDLTDYLKYGENNSLWVIVNNAPRLDVLPTAGDINIYGGLYRDVELIVTDPSHIAVDDYASEGVYVHQKEVSREKADLETVVRVRGAAGKTLTVNLAVETPNRDTVVVQGAKVKIAGDGRGSATVPVIVGNPTLWDGIENPYMYTVRVQLADEGRVCDEVTVPLGLRFFSVDPKQGFLLNGRPYRIHGVVHYEDRASVGIALKQYQIKEDLDLITEMGANAVRAAGYPHHPGFYDECDRRGILVWSEMPFIGPAYMTDKGYIHTDDFRRNGEQQLYEMIFQQFNHPSVVFWGIFSDQDPRGDDPTDYIKGLNAMAMQEDPSRMTTATSNQDGPINFVTDLIVWDLPFGWKEGMPGDLKIWLEQLQKKWGSLCSGITYGAGASIYHQEDSLYRPNYLGNWHPERWQTSLHEQYFPLVNESPFLWGWFVANMFDYGAAGRDWGEGTGTDDRGLVTFDRKYRKDAFYFYKANWNKAEPMVYIAQKRWTPRVKTTQTIRVYSNAPEVELLVNGASLGKKTGANGVFLWENVELKRGVNALEARSDTGIDYADIRVL